MMFTVPLWAGLFGQELESVDASADVLVRRGDRDAVRAVRRTDVLPLGLGRRCGGARRNMDVPISIGVILTLIDQLFRNDPRTVRDAYFDAAVSLLFLLLIGR